MIPKIIHLTCKNKNLNRVFNQCTKLLFELHPEWTIHFYDDNDAEKLIAAYFPSILKTYHSYSHSIQKADIFRIAVVYLYGGFYLDTDVQCLKSLDSLRTYSIVLGEEKTVTEAVRLKLKMAESLRIANYMFGSIPQHPFWLELIEQAVERSKRPILTESDIMISTGPGLITDIFHLKKQRYPDITLIKNTGRNCLKNCSDVPSCHFGDYAAHLHLGTWRWENKKHRYFNLDLLRKAFERMTGI